MAQRRGWGEHSIYQRKDGRWVAQSELGFIDGIVGDMQRSQNGGGRFRERLEDTSDAIGK